MHPETLVQHMSSFNKEANSQDTCVPGSPGSFSPNKKIKERSLDQLINILIIQAFWRAKVFHGGHKIQATVY